MTTMQLWEMASHCSRTYFPLDIKNISCSLVGKYGWKDVGNHAIWFCFDSGLRRELLVSLEYLSNRSTKMESEKKSFRTVFNPHCVEPFPVILFGPKGVKYTKFLTRSAYLVFPSEISHLLPIQSSKSEYIYSEFQNWCTTNMRKKDLWALLEKVLL